ncbi:MAG: sigma 54-interacting transcriptional regulator [Nitrospirota bacterium]
MLIQEDYFKNIFNTVREGILILDENMRVLSANRSFLNIFKADTVNTIGSLLYDLGNGQWNIPELRVLLEDILPKNETVDDYEIEHNFESIGRKTMLLNACKIREKKNDLPIILLAIEDITERREIENGLEKARKELAVTKISEDEAREYAESIINTVREPLIALDQDLRVVTASRSFYEVFKVTPKETVGQLIYDLGNKQWDIPKLRELLETILPQKTTFDNYEVEHEFSTIGRRIMLLNARQIQRVLGKERIILLAIEDITERKEIEAGLEKTRKELVIIKKAADEASEFAESVINTVREPLISLDQDLRVVTVSRSFYEFFKVKPEETVGHLIYDLGNKQWDIPKLRELLETILPQKTTFDNYEVEHYFAGIGRRIMLLNARQIERGRGKERIILLAIEDITERKRLEDLLTESEERYRRIFETASDGIVLLEKREGNIAHVNPAAEKMLGYPKEECIGKNLQDIGVSLDMSDFPTIMQNLNKSGIINYDDVQIKTKSGQYIDTEIYMVDRARLAQCNIRDVTERKKLEKQILEAHKKLEEQLQAENRYLLDEVKLLHTHENIVGNSEAIRSVLKQVEQVAGTDSTVLIQGETGTGKELLANAIHNLSLRKGRLLVKINCAALPPTLIESELFGREKGAFTGALARQMGRFELADNGTLFLDEISEMPLELQAKLLRVLQDGEFERLGSPKTIKVNVRLITATNRDLNQYVRDGRFREDLFYRLNIFPLFVPPLRERTEDILPLVWSFIQELGTRMGKRIESIPRKGIETLQNYGWPGNVRELRNVIERAMIMTIGPVLRIEIPKSIEAINGRSGTLEEIESRHIIDVLNSRGWRVSGKGGAAEILGLNPKTLHSRMKKLGIQRKK